jgi:hypothetical protein
MTINLLLKASYLSWYFYDNDLIHQGLFQVSKRRSTGYLHQTLWIIELIEGKLERRVFLAHSFHILGCNGNMEPQLCDLILLIDMHVEKETHRPDTQEEADQHPYIHIFSTKRIFADRLRGFLETSSRSAMIGFFVRSVTSFFSVA